MVVAVAPVPGLPEETAIETRTAKLIASLIDDRLMVISDYGSEIIFLPVVAWSVL